MEISYLILVATCLFYGLSKVISDWSEFVTKLINVLFIIGIIVLTIITGEDGFFSHTHDWYWIDFILPVPVVWIGYGIGEEIKDDDWDGIFTILSILGFIATIITACCDL